MRQDPLFRLWETQEQLEDAQVELERLRRQLAGVQHACEFLCSFALKSETQRLQAIAALSELSTQVLGTRKQGLLHTSQYSGFALLTPLRFPFSL